MATGGGPSPLAHQPNVQKMVEDVINCIQELKQEFAITQAPITDDSTTLQRFCAKLEYLLQAEQRARSSFLSGKKDYWNYFCECLIDNKGLNDGIRYVKKLNELKTPLGFGRAFLRFALQHHRLADSLQACVMRTKITGDWYNRRSLWLHPALYSALINSLYDLNDIQFDLAPQGYDLDAAWPTFARKSFSPSGWGLGMSRSSSIASLSSLNSPDTSLPTLKLDTSIPEGGQSSFVGESADMGAWTDEELATQNQISDLQNQVDTLTAQIAQQQTSTEELIKSYQTRCDELEEKSSSVENENASLRTELQEMEFKFIAKKQQLKKENDESKRLNERVVSLERQNSDILTNAEKLLTEKSENLDSKSSDVSQAELLLTRLTESEAKVNDLLCDERQLKSDIEKITSNFEKLKTGIHSTTAIGDCSVDVLLEKFSAKLSELYKEKETIQNESQMIQTRCLLLETENDNLNLKIQEFERQILIKTETLESQETDNQLMKNEVLKLSNELEKMEAQYQEKEKELNGALSASVSLNQEIRLEIEKLTEELQRREGSVEREREDLTCKVQELETELEYYKNLERTEFDLTSSRNSIDNKDMKRSVTSDTLTEVSCLDTEDESGVQTESDSALQTESEDVHSPLADANDRTKILTTTVELPRPEVKIVVTGVDAEGEELEEEAAANSDDDIEIYETSDLELSGEHVMEALRESRVLELTESNEVLLSEKITEAVEQEAGDALSRLREELVRAEAECEALRGLLQVVTEEQPEPEKVKELKSVDPSLVSRSEQLMIERRHQNEVMAQQDVKINDLKSQVNSLKEQIDQDAEEHYDQETQISSLKLQITSLQSTETLLNQRLDLQRELCEELTNRLVELEVRIKEAEESQEKVVQCELDHNATEVADSGKDLENLRKEINFQVSQIEGLRHMIENAEKELKDREYRISSLDLTNQRLADEMRLLQDLVSTANESSQRFETQIKSFEERITIMTRSFHGLQEENQRLLAEKTRLISDNGTLRQQLSAETEHRKSLEMEQDLFEKSLVQAFEEKSQILNEEMKRSRLKINRMFDLIGNPDLDLEALIADDLAVREAKDDRCEYSSDDDDVTSGSYDVMSAEAGISQEDPRKKSKFVRVSCPGDSEGTEDVSLVKKKFKDPTKSARDLLNEDPKCEGCKKRNKVIERLEKKNENQVEILNDLDKRLTEKCRECDTMNSEMAGLIIERSCLAGKLELLAQTADQLQHEISEQRKAAATCNHRDDGDSEDDNSSNHGNEASENIESDSIHDNEQNEKNEGNGCLDSGSCREKLEKDVFSIEDASESAEALTEVSDFEPEMTGNEIEQEISVTTTSGIESEINLTEEAPEMERDDDDVSNLINDSKQNFYLNFPKSTSTNELRSPLTPDAENLVQKDVSELTVEELLAEKLRLEHKLVELTLELDRHEADYAEMERYITDITNRFKQNKAELETHISQLEERLRSEKLHYDSAVKCYANQGFDLAKLTDRMAEQEGVIQSLEIELQAIRDERQIEKDRQWVELNELKASLMQREEECCLLNDQLKKTSAAYEEEHTNHQRLKRQTSLEKTKFDELLKQKDKELTMYITDSVELKKKLIKLIKEKDSLWKKTDKLEYQQRVKAAETWMNDADVTHCLGCKQEFSFMLRKHHCRLCGRIFCNMCSNNWVLTTHSKTKSRVCNLCFIERESGSPSPGPGGGEELEEDASIQIPRIRSTTWTAGGVPDSIDSSNISGTVSPVSRSSLVSPVSSLSYSLQSSPSPSPDGKLLSGLPVPASGLSGGPATGLSRESVPVQSQGVPISGLPQNATDEIKTRMRGHQENSSDFAATTEELTGGPVQPRPPELKVSTDLDQVPGDRDEIFHLISDEEIARSLTSSDPSRSLEEALTRSTMLQTSDMTSQTDDVIIQSGKMFGVPVLVEKEGVALSWQFSTEPKSILFSLTYRRCETSEEETLVPPCHCNSHRQRVRGELTAQKAGHYTLYFDNTAARNTDKKLNYAIEVKTSLSAP